MTPLAADLGQWLLGTLLVVVLVGFGTGWLTRRRRNVWADLARKRGLTLTNLPHGPQVTGQLQRRTIAVSTDLNSSDDGAGGIAVISVSVRLNGVPADMTAEGVPGLLGNLVALLEDRIAFNSGAFDQHVVVKGHSASGISAYWNQHRQQRFLKLIDEVPCDQIAIRDQALVAELREIISDGGQLEALLDELLAAAEELDGNSAMEGE